MTRLTLVDARKFEKLLKHLGFVKVRQKGSHVFYRHPDGRYTTLPNHKGDLITRSLLREILRQIKITIEEYSELIEKI
jgi:predicted RNA binding protein YcfA (HicA-like mRNA interferase family)